MRTRLRDHVWVEWRCDADVPDRRGEALLGQRVRRTLGRLDELPDGEDAHVGAGPEASRPQAGSGGRDAARRRLGPADRDGAVGNGERILEHDAEFLVRRRREHRDSRDFGQEGEVEHSVMARPVVAGDPGSVDAEDDRKLVEADVVVELIPRA